MWILCLCNCIRRISCHRRNDERTRKVGGLGNGDTFHQCVKKLCNKCRGRTVDAWSLWGKDSVVDSYVCCLALRVVAQVTGDCYHKSE